MIAMWIGIGVAACAATGYAGYRWGWERGFDDAEAIWKRCADSLVDRLHRATDALRESADRESATQASAPKVGVGAAPLRVGE